MQNKILYKILVVLSLSVFAVSNQGFGEETKSNKKAVDSEAQFKRVGGQYLVKKIKKTKNNTFLIEFHSVVKNGKADIIKLESDHVHMDIQEGQSLRISAEVDREKGNIVIATQVLLFLPRAEGPMPVWMLSKKGRGKTLKAVRYLEMHAPQSDYLLL